MLGWIQLLRNGGCPLVVFDLQRSGHPPQPHVGRSETHQVGVALAGSLSQLGGVLQRSVNVGRAPIRRSNQRPR